MPILERKALVVLLIALSALASALPVRAAEEAKPSKPLNLAASARRAPAVQAPRTQAVPAPNADSIWAPASPADAIAPLITGATSAPAPAPAPANPPPAPRPAKAGPPKSAPPAASSPADDEVAQFCNSVADPAVDARLAWQLKELEKAESLLRERIAEVEAKRAEYEKWMSLRDEFLKKAEASVVEIYSRMKPEAAATQIAVMSDDTAAAVLAKLSPRSASAIFSEMDSARAAHLADILGGMRRTDEGKSRQ
jgi:flagellar motility protein MotE (MotC chaperone)